MILLSQEDIVIWDIDMVILIDYSSIEVIET